MEYISTRNIQKTFSFKDVFLNGLASEGGLYVPKQIPLYSKQDLEKIRNLSYEELAVKIILDFCDDEFNESEIKNLVKRSYKDFRVKDVVSIRKIGKINLIISLAYMYVLATIGTLMLIEGVAAIDRARRKIFLKKKLHSHYWIHGLPFRMKFKKSKLYESALAPIVLGLIVGFIASIMGVGGAFLLVPALIYVIGMPTKLVPGTSLFVTIFVTAFVTILHAFNYQTIDIILVIILISGSIIGIQIGIKAGEYLEASELKTLMAILFLLVGIAVAYNTFFRDHNNILNNNSSNPVETNQLYESLIELSNTFPASYGLFCIFLAVGLGILASIIRRSASNYKKKLPLKKAAW